MTEAPEIKKKVFFEPFPKQLEFVDAVFSGNYRIILYGGAIRGGKTWASVGTTILLSKVYPGSRWAIVRKNLPALKTTVIKSFFEVCPPRFIKKYNQDTQTVTFINGSQIIFWSENFDDDKDLDRWKGLEVSGFVLEECNELQEVSFNKAIERAGSHIPLEGKKPKPLIMMTCNPSNNWVKRLFYDRYMGYPEAGPMPDKWLYIPAKITDNPKASSGPDGEEYMASLKTMSSFAYEVFVNGNWDIQLKVGGEYFKCFEIGKHVRKVGSPEEIKYNPNLPLHISWDENVNPYLPCGIFQVEIMPVMQGEKTINFYKVLMIDEIASKNPSNNVDSVCREICRRYQGHQAGMFVYGDATANKEDTKLEQGYNFYRLILDALKQFQPRSQVLQSNPAVYMRANWMNTVFEKEVGNLQILVSDKCKTAVNDFILTKEDENGAKAKTMITDPITKVRYQEHGHFADLLEYFMVSKFSRQFQEWQAGGAITSITYGRNNRSKNTYQ